jgi:subtilisin family serine protease
MTCIASTTRSRFAATGLRTVLLAGLLAAGPFGFAKGAGGDPALAGEILLRLRSTNDLGPLLVKHRLSLVKQFGSRPIYRVSVIGSAEVKDNIAALGLDPDVLTAEPNFVHRSPEARRNNAWTIGSADAYTVQWAPAALRLGEAQALSTGAGVRVAVLDTGVDRAHPALAGRLIAGFDFVDGDADPSEVGSHETSASFGHGTHVAGLVALAAPGAQIMPLRVLDAAGEGNAAVLAEAMLHAVDPDANPATDDGARVINMSLGSLSRTQILDTVTKLATCAIPPRVVDPIDDFSDPGYNADKDRCNALGGAIVVAAAGNDASDAVREYPAAEGAYGLLAVTASTAASKIAGFANFGAWVHVAAPGEGITSSVPGGLYASWSGTSMAAPLAAGTAALVMAREPGLVPRDVARRLVRASGNLCGTKLRRIDAAAALQNLVPPDAACP